MVPRGQCERLDGLCGVWLTEVQPRTGSARTPVEYGCYVGHFAARLDVLARTLADASLADAHAPHPDKRRQGVPGASSVNVRQDTHDTAFLGHYGNRGHQVAVPKDVERAIAQRGRTQEDESDGQTDV